MSMPSTLRPTGFDPLRRPASPLAAPMPPHAAVRGAAPAVSRRAAALDPVRIAKDACFISLLLLLNVFGNAGAAVFFLILVAMVVWSPSAAFKAMIIMWLGLMTNTAFVPKSLVWTPCRLVLPYLCLARFTFDMVTLRSSLLSQPFYWIFLLYCATMAMCSIISGWFTPIALFKLVNFWCAFTAVFSGAFVLVRRRIDIGEWLVSMILASTGIGVLAVATGRSMVNFGLGMSNHFGGAFLHPNCHSSYASLFIVTLLSVFAFSPYRRRFLVLPLMAIWALFIAWSRSRTAVLATSLGVVTMLPFIVSAARPAGWIRRANIRRGTVFAIGILTGFGVLVADIFTGNGISSAAIAFVNKSGNVNEEPRSSLDIDKVLYSRVGKISESMENFRANPVFGIGFQVAKTEFFARNATIFTAPAEKGFLPSAVLEEGGVVGAAAFVLFVVAMPITFLARRNIPALAAFFAFLGSTVTEVSIFSPGGSGGFCWVMVAAAFVFGESCWVKRQSTPGLPGHIVPDRARPTISLIPHPLGGISPAG